ncbi:homeobox-leucine zipper protein ANTHOCYANINLESS [Trifolium repens]|nr:homeobox-leucine zipper protein ANTHOCYANINLESS [Trifolium repens]
MPVPSLEDPVMVLLFEWPSGRIEKLEGNKAIHREYTTIEPKLLVPVRDSSCVALLPSGFSILPDGHSNNNTITGSSSDGSGIGGNSGYFLAVGMQMLLNDLQTSKLTTESVDTINELISCTI